MIDQDLIEKDIEGFLEKHRRKDLLRFITAGSVDDGKSTLIGRLLYDAEMVFDDHLDALERDSERVGHAGEGRIDFALLVDGLRSEREQGITIDVAYRYFATPRRKFILADAPGHEQYTRNMATGASTADLAIILIDARQGVLPQTRRHSFIASLFGIKHIVVAVNKMDLVDYSQDVFEEIRRAYSDFSAKLEVSDVHFIPISAVEGENVVHRSDNMSWYQGSPLLDYLETVHISGDRNLIDMRFPVQYVLRPSPDFRGFSGAVVSGVLRQGDEIMTLPSKQRSRIKSIETFEGPVAEAGPPAPVTLTLEDEVDVGRGDLLVHPRNLPTCDAHFEAMLVWMSEEKMQPGRPYLIKHPSGEVQAAVSRLHYRIDINTFHREPATHLQLNEIGRVEIATTRPLLFDPYERNKHTGAFILIDRLTNATLAAGVIRDVEALADDDVGQQRAELTAHRSLVSAEERAQRFGQKPFTLWLTGLPRSGKASIAYALERRLFDQGYTPFVLHGTNLRLGINRDLTFSGLDRSENVRRAGEIARANCDLGLITIAALVSPDEADRRAARDVVGSERFIEVYCDAPAEVCEKRDETGLFARARQGRIKNLTGLDGRYDAPTSPEIRLETSTLDVGACCDRILEWLKEQGWLTR